MCILRVRRHSHVQEECRALISACMARGNAQLALSIYGTMCRVGPGSSSATADRHREQLAWPPATLETVSAVVGVPCCAAVLRTPVAICPCCSNQPWFEFAKCLIFCGRSHMVSVATYEAAGCLALQHSVLFYVDWLTLCMV